MCWEDINESWLQGTLESLGELLKYLLGLILRDSDSIGLRQDLSIGVFKALDFSNVWPGLRTTTLDSAGKRQTRNTSLGELLTGFCAELGLRQSFLINW